MVEHTPPVEPQQNPDGGENGSLGYDPTDNIYDNDPERLGRLERARQWTAGHAGRIIGQAAFGMAKRADRLDAVNAYQKGKLGDGTTDIRETTGFLDRKHIGIRGHDIQLVTASERLDGDLIKAQKEIARLESLIPQEKKFSGGTEIGRLSAADQAQKDRILAQAKPLKREAMRLQSKRFRTYGVGSDPYAGLEEIMDSYNGSLKADGKPGFDETLFYVPQGRSIPRERQTRERSALDAGKLRDRLLSTAEERMLTDYPAEQPGRLEPPDGRAVRAPEALATGREIVLGDKVNSLRFTKKFNHMAVESLAGKLGFDIPDAQKLIEFLQQKGVLSTEYEHGKGFKTADPEKFDQAISELLQRGGQPGQANGNRR